MERPNSHFDFLSSDFLSSLNFGQVADMHFVLPYMTFCLVTFCLVLISVKLRTDIQTEYDAYEPTVHTHRWAQKLCNPFKMLDNPFSQAARGSNVAIPSKDLFQWILLYQSVYLRIPDLVSGPPGGH